jgi:hypothetical protein
MHSTGTDRHYEDPECASAGNTKDNDPAGAASPARSKYPSFFANLPVLRIVQPTTARASTGAIDREVGEHTLLDAALACGLFDEEAERTISSGLDAGEREPRDLGHLGCMPRSVAFGHDIEENLP